MSIGRSWDEQAERWASFAGDRGRDRPFWLFNLPRFLELVPPPGRATVDVGCGEGRLGAELVRLGHRLVGVDASAALVERARERHEALVADAAALPFADASFDLTLAFMSLHDMDDPAGAVREVARVLEPGGCFCVALEHPFQVSGRWEQRAADAPFLVEGSYVAERVDEVDFGEGLVARSRRAPLEAWARMLEEAGLLIEALREPVPPEDYFAGDDARRRWARVPMFLHLRALKR